MVTFLKYCKCRRFYACNSKYVIDAKWEKGHVIVIFSVTNSSFHPIFIKIDSHYTLYNDGAICVRKGTLVWAFSET